LVTILVEKYALLAAKKLGGYLNGKIFIVDNVISDARHRQFFI